MEPVILLILLGAGAGITLWIMGRFQTPRVKGGGGVAAGSVSVIIPARNEAENLPRLLRSISQQQSPPGEVIVVDDGSTDGTDEVARSMGARVVTAPPPPPGWSGKTWALTQGAQAAQGEVFLFLDADTWFEPGGLDHLLAHHGTGVFSVGPYHRVQRPYENLSLFFNVAMCVGTVPRGLFGQCLFVSRADYVAVGGHGAVPGQVLENLFLAKKFQKLGRTVESCLGRGIIAFRMYPRGLQELVVGWKKGFSAGAGQSPRGVMLLVVGWMTLLMLPVSLFWLPGVPWGGVYGFNALAVFFVSRRVGNFHWMAAVLYPVPLIFFFGLFFISHRQAGRQVHWKGRNIRVS